MAKKAAKKAVSKKTPVAKKATAKKAASKKTASKKSAAKKTVAKKEVAPAKKVVKRKAAKTAEEKAAAAKAAAARRAAAKAEAAKARAAKAAAAKAAENVNLPKRKKLKTLTPFLKSQRQRLLDLRDSLLNTIDGVARDNLTDNDNASAFGMHQADAGSDAYDRDFALDLLSKEHDALYEIDDALERIKYGAYGVCEMSGVEIPKIRLEAMPFARFTVECQSKIEREQGYGGRRHSTMRNTALAFGDSAKETVD